MPDRPVPDPASPLRAEADDLSTTAIGGATDEVIPGHTYDGIREYDNPMPGWWVGLFVLGVLFAPVYVLGIHVFDWIDTYEEDFAEHGAELEAVRLAYAATGPAVKTDAGALRAYAADPLLAAAGAEPFAAICAACHGQAGEGVIGPNLTDAYWLYGGDPASVWTSIGEGFPQKGMPPMNTQLGPEELTQVLAYVFALQGTDPPNAKAPEGELVQ